MRKCKHLVSDKYYQIYKSKAMFTSGHSIAFSVVNECTQPGIWLAALLGSTASVVDVLGSNIRVRVSSS